MSTPNTLCCIMHDSASVAKKTLVFSYGRSFNGFAAKLTDEEAARVSGAYNFYANLYVELRCFQNGCYTNRECSGM